MEIIDISSTDELRYLDEKKQLHGLFRLSDETYHQGPGYSSTQLKLINRSPAHFKCSSKPDTKALRFGVLVHTQILEPELMKYKYIVEPKIDKRTLEGKSKYKKFLEEVGERKVVSNSDMNLAASMYDSFKQNKITMQMLNGSLKEISAYTYCEHTGLLLKARADMLHLGKVCSIADLKTCEDARPRQASMDAAKYKYHLSAAYYLDIFSRVLETEITTFVWAFIEKTPPYAIKIYVADNETIIRGRLEYINALHSLKLSMDFDMWPAYNVDDIENLKLPNWVKE